MVAVELKLLDYMDMQKMLGVSRCTVIRWWKAGIIPAPMKMSSAKNGAVRWNYLDIKKWIEENSSMKGCK